MLRRGDALAETESEAETVQADTSRRAFLLKLAGGSLGLAAFAVGVGRLLEGQQEASGAGQALSAVATGTPTPAPGPALPTGAPTPAGPPPVSTSTPLPRETADATLRDRVTAAPGTRPEVTANGDLYRTDIDTLPQMLDKASWKLEVGGLFDRPRPLTLSDLLAHPAVTQPISLRHAIQCSRNVMNERRALE